MFKKIKTYLKKIFHFEDPILKNENESYWWDYSKFIEHLNDITVFAAAWAIWFISFASGLLFSELPFIIIGTFILIGIGLSGLAIFFNFLDLRAWKNGDKLSFDEKIERKRNSIKQYGYDSLDAFDEYVLKEQPSKFKKIEIKAKV